MQLQLYPANLTKEQFAAGQSAIFSLPLAIDPKVSQKINGDWSLQFEYPAGYAIKPDMLVLAGGQLYRITEVEPEGVKASVRALHMFYDLRDKMIVNIETAETTPGGINQKTALQQVLNGTPFEAGEVDTDLVLDYLDILQKDVVSVIKEQILGFWGGELQPDNWTINIRKKAGADRGVQIRHGKNIKGIRYSESLDGVITRLHILGYRNANIESINDGKDYIDSPNIVLYANVKEGLVTFSDDDLPEDLMSKGLEYLATVDTPRVTVSVDMAKVMTSVQYEHYQDLERIELGDTVRIIHPLGIDIETRVTSREYDPVTGENIRVEYSNESKNLYSSIASAQQASEIIKMITDRKGHIRGEQLRGMVDLLTTRLYASGSYNVAEVRENEGMLFENTNEDSVDYGALFVGPGLFSLASVKDENGSWVWRTFGTGQGFVADEIVAGVLQASLVKILGTEHFYWNADNIVIEDPTDPDRQIRYGRYDGLNYGIGFTHDGGESWTLAIGFEGPDLSANPSFSNMENTLRDITDDSKVTLDEKRRLSNELDSLNAAYQALADQAEKYKPEEPDEPDPDEDPSPDYLFYNDYISAQAAHSDGFTDLSEFINTLLSEEGTSTISQDLFQSLTQNYQDAVIRLNGLVRDAEARRIDHLQDWRSEIDQERTTTSNYMRIGNVKMPDGSTVFGMVIGQDVGQLDDNGNVISVNKTMSMATADKYAILVNGEEASFFNQKGMSADTAMVKSVEISGYWKDTIAKNGGFIRKWIGGDT